MAIPPVAYGDTAEAVPRGSGTNAVLDVRNVRKDYGPVTAVDGASFVVGEGEIFGLLGPNGAGKTTTTSMIATLLRPDAGEISVAGLDAVRDAAKVRRLLGLVPQELAVYPTLSARENLEYFGGIYGLHGKERRRRIGEALAIAGLEAYADKPQVWKFSGGMRRRLNLACALVHRPRLLLLDEPTVGVDTQSRNLILDNIRRLNKEEGMAVLFTTHYLEEAESLCERVAIIDNGKIIACDRVAALIASGGGTIFEVTLGEPWPGLEAALHDSQGVIEVTHVDGARYTVLAEDQQRGLAALVQVAARHDVVFEEMRIVPPSLEQVFLSLTGRELRDEGQ